MHLLECRLTQRLARAARYNVHALVDSDDPYPNQPPATTVRKLQRLIARNERAQDDARAALDALQVEIARVIDDTDASYRGVAHALDVAEPTVQSWLKQGRKLRQQQ